MICNGHDVIWRNLMWYTKGWRWHRGVIEGFEVIYGGVDVIYEGCFKDAASYK